MIVWPWINVADKQPPVCVVSIVTFNCDGTPEDSVSQPNMLIPYQPVVISQMGFTTLP